MSEDENDHSIEALSGLKREMNPPPELENRVVAQLLDRGLLQRRRDSSNRKWITAAAAVLIFALGFATAKIYRTPAHPLQYTYVLLLREGPDFSGKKTHEPSLVQEYTQWARGIAQSGTMITGEKLTSESRLFKYNNGAVTQIQETSADPDGAIAGFFLLKAGTDQEAVEKALDCPHLRHGGAVELRRIDRATGHGD